MCGICGIVLEGGNAHELGTIVSKMAATLSHRGPDASGICTKEGWAVGHTRLSIISLADGAQPMSDDRGYTITYNGELYNYRELRSDLEADGEVFSTESDTEVVLKAYVRWGRKCLARFNGMFAFAVIDSNQREAFLARDGIGIKPLYYSVLPRGLVFSSEIKAVLQSGLVSHETDVSLFPFYLTRGYFPRQFTPFKQVCHLRPGHWLNLRAGKLTSGCYWSADAAFADGIRRITPEDEEEIVHLIRDAVQKQTVADVPVGVLLSGGLDSGIVTSSLARTGNRVRTFTVHFPSHAAMDEGVQARAVAAHFGTEHHEIVVSAEEAQQHWEGLLDHFDQPFADDSAINTFLISKYVRSHVKVVLSGDGGDEQWGGYQNYRRYLQLRLGQRFMGRRMLRRSVAAGRGLTDHFSDSISSRLIRRMGFYGNLLATDPCCLYRDLDGLVRRSFLGNLCGERLHPYLTNGSRQPLMPQVSITELDAIMLNDLQEFMVDAVLRKVDMMSMAVGLEVRVPLLDRRIVEKSLRLSWRDKVSTRETKVFIRRLFRHDLPHAVIKGKKKGFGVPLDDWLRGPLREPMRDILLGRACRQRGVLSPRAVRGITDDHLLGRAHNGKLIFGMMALERWLQRYDG